ncbi:MAG: DUF1684 domain-containing protein [Cytophagales bacterium]|nr:DUF1684 domain-containing protein [Cytophagales bacterium]
MKRFRIFLPIAIVIIGVVLYYSIPGGLSEEEYQNAILAERVEKDTFMKRDPSSPFAATRDSVRSLNYFAPDQQYRIRATLQVIQNKKVIVLGTSTGEASRYLEYGWAAFNLDGIENKLLILEIMDMGPQRGKLFLAFADETSAKETYGAGRYLDVKKVPAASTIELDFNKAYNPYCAYTDAFSCPLPPRENILAVAIRAGEMTY